MKVTPLSSIAVDAARRILAAADVQHPRDIHAEAIAARNGAMILYGPASTARGYIVRAGKRVIIHVNERMRDKPPARFTIAHELGHHVLHELEDHFSQCDGTEKRKGKAWVVEREANDFAAEFLMPESLAALHCNAERPNLEDVERVARIFRTSPEATAIRFVQLATAPCAAVLVRAGVIQWAPESAAFPGKIVKRRTLHPASVAACVTAGRDEGTAREVPGEAWGGKEAFVEEAIRLGGDGLVLVWLVPARAALSR